MALATAPGWLPEAIPRGAALFFSASPRFLRSPLLAALALSAVWQGCVDFDETLRIRLCAQAELEHQVGVCGLKALPEQFTGEPLGTGNISGAWIDGSVARQDGYRINSTELAAAVAISSNGERWMAGKFMGEADVGLLMYSDSGWSTFVSKTNAAGQGEWALGFASPGDAAPTRIALAPGGDGFVTGTYQGAGTGTPVPLNVNRGGGAQPGIGPNVSLPDTASPAGFVIRLHPEGTPVTARGLGGAPGLSVTPRGLAAGSDGVVVVGSASGGELTVDGQTVAGLAGSTGEGLFVVGLDAGLGYRWHVASAGCTFAAADGVALDGAGAVYVVGRGQGPGCVIGGAQPFAGRDPALAYAFVARYAAGGQGAVQGQWLQVLDQADLSAGGSIAVDGAGNPVAFINAGATRATLFKLDSTGASVWSPIDVTGGAVRGQALAADGQGNVWITGELQGSALQLGDLTPDLTPGLNVFAAQLTPDARVRWGRAFESDNWLAPGDVAVDPAGEAVVLGSFSNRLAIGTTSQHLQTWRPGATLFLLRFYP